MELDLKAVLDKVFDCLETTKLVETGSRFLLYFKSAYKKAFSTEYITKKELAARPKASAAGKRMRAHDEEKFERAVARKRIRLAPTKNQKNLDNYFCLKK